MGQNNTWIRQSSSRTVLIFVHGILSNSDACWRNTKTTTYWPQLVTQDPMFENPAVFVSGYAAGPGAGLYDVRAAADDILALLRSPGSGPAPLTKDRLLFVCHSQGGIVVRQMLSSNFEEFRDKRVGVVLCGSPSWGSFYGTVLAPLALFIRYRQATALSWGGSTLRNLDRDFLDLLNKKDRIPDLSGICLVETRGRLLGIPIPKMVAEPSATRYFRWYPIPKTTHSSLVKPDSVSHASHVRLRDFARTGAFLTQGPFKAALGALLESIQRVLDAYGAAAPLAKQGKAESLEQLFKDVRHTLAQVDSDDRLTGIPLQPLLTAPLSGKQEWAFYNFSRDDFIALHNSLNALSGKVA
jgi:hypothetical protein